MKLTVLQFNINIDVCKSLLFSTDIWYIYLMWNSLWEWHFKPSKCTVRSLQIWHRSSSVCIIYNLIKSYIRHLKLYKDVWTYLWIEHGTGRVGNEKQLKQQMETERNRIAVWTRLEQHKNTQLVELLQTNHFCHIQRKP